jgi:hypothetical protein
MDDPTRPRIEFRRSGGLFAGNQLETELELGQLDPDRQRQLRQALSELDIAQLARRSPLRGPGADAYQYDLTIDDGHTRHQLTATATAMPTQLRPLIDLLEQHALHQRRRR